MVLENILNSIDEDIANVPAIKRFIKKARKGLRQKSPNDVDHFVYLASAVYMAGDNEAAIQLLLFVDKNTEDSENSWQDLICSLAHARCMLIHFLKSQGATSKVNDILSRPRIEEARDLYPIRGYEGLSLVKQEVKILAEQFEYNESNEESKHSFLLGSAYECMMSLVVIFEAYVETEIMDNVNDRKLLESEIARYKERFYYYLIEKPRL